MFHSLWGYHCQLLWGAETYRSPVQVFNQNLQSTCLQLACSLVNGAVPTAKSALATPENYVHVSCRYVDDGLVPASAILSD